MIRNELIRKLSRRGPVHKLDRNRPVQKLNRNRPVHKLNMIEIDQSGNVIVYKLIRPQAE